MNKITYDLSMGLGLACAIAGAAVLWGVGVALLVAGGLIIGLTGFGAVFMRAKG